MICTCNRLLQKNCVTTNDANIAQLAHIEKILKNIVLVTAICQKLKKFPKNNKLTINGVNDFWMLQEKHGDLGRDEQGSL